MNKINIKNIKNEKVKILVEKVMNEYNLKKTKVTIRVGSGNPDIIFSKKAKDFYSNGGSFFWDETVKSFDTNSKYQYHDAVILWREFFNEVSHFDKYRIEEIVIYR